MKNREAARMQKYKRNKSKGRLIIQEEYNPKPIPSKRDGQITGKFMSFDEPNIGKKPSNPKIINPIKSGLKSR